MIPLRLLFIALLVVFGCEDKEGEDVVEHPLVGIWEMTSIIEEVVDEEIQATVPSDDTNSFTLVINSDSTYAFDRLVLGDSFSGSGIWSTIDDTLYTDTSISYTLFPKQLYSFQNDSLFLSSEHHYSVYLTQLIIKFTRQ